MRTAVVAATILTCSVVAFAQDQGAKRPVFDSASVKVNTSIEAGIMRRPTPGQVYFGNAPLTVVIEEAFGVRPYQVVNLPDWIATAKFDIVAKYDPAQRKQTQVMLQTLLEDRFSLRVHREMRELPIYALVKARADGQLGPGLRPSTVDCTAPQGQRSPCTMRIMPNLIDATGTRWGFLATNIGVWDRPVIDKTGLEGPFDVKLEWTPDPAQARSPEAAAAIAAATTPGGRVSIFTALQEQLGLRLEATRGPVEVLVVDRLERPTPD